MALRAWLKLDETSGLVAADASGNGQDFTNNGATVGQAPVAPTGTGSYLFGNNTGHNLQRADQAWMRTTPFSVSAWVKGSSFSSRDCVASRDSFTVNRGWSLYIFDGKLEFYTSATKITGATTLLTNTAYMVTLTYDGTTGRLYLNGTQDGSAAFAFSQSVDARPLIVGASHAGSASLNFPFHGLIDEFRYYDHALSLAEVGELYSGQPTQPTGSGAVSLPLLSASGAGQVPQFGDGGVTLPILSASGLAAVDVPPTADGLVGLPLPTVDAAATVAVTQQSATDSVNQANGRTRVCRWSVAVEPAVRQIPAKRKRGHDYATAVSISSPTMVDGRPT